jgi:hypothetical protein
MANEKIEVVNRVEAENKLTISMGRKKNMGNYQSMDTAVHYSINIPEDASDDDIKQKIEKCKIVVSQALEDAEKENQSGF